MACITTVAEQKRISAAARKVGGYSELVRLSREFEALGGRKNGVRIILGPDGEYQVVKMEQPSKAPVVDRSNQGLWMHHLLEFARWMAILITVIIIGGGLRESHTPLANSYLSISIVLAIWLERYVPRPKQIKLSR